MRMKERAHGPVTILEFQENLTGGAQSDALRGHMEALTKAGNSNVIFNLKNVKFIASQGVGMIMAAKMLCDKAKGRLVTCAPNQRIVSLFNLYHIGQVMDFYETEEEALASFEVESAN